MAAAVTQSQIVAARIESGIILDVDITTYTVSVTTEFSKKPVTGVKFATPYQHYANGEGIYFMPEVGSLCWVCSPSDHNRPFVIAWGPASEDGDARAKKKDLNPGDIYMGTRDENFLILRRGGVVQIGGGPLTQRIFLPINNTIKDFCENFGLHTLGGDLEWTVERDESTTDGKRPGLLSIKAREFADDEKPIAKLQIGSHGDGDDRILSLLINDSGKSGQAAKIELSLGKDGGVKWSVKKGVEWTVDDTFKLTVKKDITLHTDKNFNIESDKVVMKGDSGIEITSSGGDVKIKGSSKVSIDPKVEVGGSKAVALSTPLIQWLGMHMHPTTSPGAPTGPPSSPPGSDIASTTIFGS